MCIPIDMIARNIKKSREKYTAACLTEISPHGIRVENLNKKRPGSKPIESIRRIFRRIKIIRLRLR
jgi:hypothetical protein